jgi:CheY-like chemotaxis protein
VSEAFTPHLLRRLSDARVLWVDDVPENNVFERRALEALGISVTVSTSTEDALEKARRSRYSVIISDMGRYENDHHVPQAGYALLEALREAGDSTAFIIYAGSNKPEHKAEAKKRGAIGTTNRPQELFEMVLSAIAADGKA